MDADDVAHPERLAKQVGLLERADLDAVGSQVRVVGPEGRPVPTMERYVRWINDLTEHDAIVAMRFVELPLVNPTVLGRRAVFELGFRAAGQQLLANVDARVEAGPPTVILGPNGAGKSLTLRLAHGLLEPSSGEVRWCGPETPGRATDPGTNGRDQARHQAQHQAMVFDRPVLLRRSAAANVDYALALRGLARAELVAPLPRALLELRGVTQGVLGGHDRPAARLLPGGAGADASAEPGVRHFRPVRGVRPGRH